MGAEQVEALFGSVTVTVLAGMLLALTLIYSIQRLGYLNLATGIGWIAYIGICTASHILLSWCYGHSATSHSRWRFWAMWFTAISLAEGIGWGWATLGLATRGGFEIASLTVIATLGLAAGSIPTYSPYLPAFLALFLPAMTPFTLASLKSANDLQRVAGPLAMLFACVIGVLGLLANRAYKQRIVLKIRTEELAADLKRQRVIAEKASRAKSSFLAAASHDLRQPVHALGLFVGALRQIPLPDNAERLVEQIDTSTTAMDSLFDALLDISRLDAGVIAVNRRPFAIGSILARVCLDYASEALAKGITLRYVPCNAIVDSDPTLIERIARNLVANAVRYTDSGRIVVGCRRRNAHVALQVWDTGRGIPRDKHERVFQEYYQLGNPERDREKGLGLGLAIVRRLTDLLGCEMALRSEPGRGSCFEVSITLSDGTTSALDIAVEEPGASLTTGLVVVVDDEREIRAGMSSLLTGWGYEVVVASSADEAVLLLSAITVRPALLICDLRLPDGESGIDAINRLRAEYNENIPAMLITGDMGAGRLMGARTSGFVLLYKPVPNGKLRAAITNLISSETAAQLSRD
ncbi:MULTISPECIES: ATP-binding response regulator [Paraburkholderia]|uniref:histidine kinase n=2 Tax=Paraburkholderia TaxID=1822464 RepID=A0A7Z0B1K7_9BURK|nr:hybrid sensor histidine kinase/response regulator [Paraburkholderia bryophila]NYH16685.1 signal transduction histidine kinase/CheY-like chemotaxis protein [Paraburkholderia bryophila]NYH24881.1 signal transduction histidine kinase/CheY-like chemotaxis protein [Paraburkholderia bryophila]